jgi:hypothetical protein
MSVGDERLKPKGEESTCLVYTGMLGELEHLKMEARLINEKFASVMGECVILKKKFFLFCKNPMCVDTVFAKKKKHSGNNGSRKARGYFGKQKAAAG